MPRVLGVPEGVGVFFWARNPCRVPWARVAYPLFSTLLFLSSERGEGGGGPGSVSCILISHKVLIMLSCKNQIPHKNVNLFSILVIMKGKLTIFGGNLP